MRDDTLTVRQCGGIRGPGRHALVLATLLVAFLPVPAAAQQEQSPTILLFDVQAEIVTPEAKPNPAYKHQWEVWNTKPIEFTCKWSVKVASLAWHKVAAWTPTVTSFSGSEGLWALDASPTINNLRGLPASFKKSSQAIAVPNGVHPVGSVFAGQFKSSFVPDWPGQWRAGCFATLDAMFPQITQKACDGSAYAWCDAQWHDVQVHRPPPFLAEELPVPEILAPVKAPGGETLALPLDVIGVPLSAALSSASVMPAYIQSQSGKWDYVSKAGCGVLVKDTKDVDKIVGYSCEPVPFWTWATQYTRVFEERWHLQLLKRQANGLFKPVKTFSGPVKGQKFESTVAPGFFDVGKDGGGVWRLSAWVTQENTPQGVVTGKASSVDFEVKLLPKRDPTVAKPGTWAPIVPPAASANASDQPAGATIAGPVPASMPPASTPATPRSADVPAFGTGGPLRSALPAVQAPATSTAAPTGTPATSVARTSVSPAGSTSRTPDWRALGNAPAGRSSSPPGMVPPAATRTQPVAPATIAAASPAGAGDASIRRELAAQSCVPATGTSRFACATRAGFDRCEALRRQRKVDQCVLQERR
ncbi:hypothetical protein BURK1_03170 [Burkholderiales bacterium]|nr:hypothetical protein BURK1_03170 [Burkholderiales bacterium]